MPFWGTAPVNSGQLSLLHLLQRAVWSRMCFRYGYLVAPSPLGHKKSCFGRFNRSNHISRVLNITTWTLGASLWEHTGQRVICRNNMTIFCPYFWYNARVCTGHFWGLSPSPLYIHWAAQFRQAFGVHKAADRNEAVSSLQQTITHHLLTDLFSQTNFDDLTACLRRGDTDVCEFSSWKVF